MFLVILNFFINRPPFLITYVLMLDFVSFLTVVPLRFDVKYHCEYLRLKIAKSPNKLTAIGPPS